MKKVQVSASNNYEILIEKGSLELSGVLVSSVFKNCNVALITDDIVNKLYAPIVESSLKESGFNVVKFVFPHGEESKSIEVWSRIQSFLAENHISRKDIIVALGGGVVGDMAGFVASTYLRGISFVQIPTTLLAMVDSSVGGKTAVDLPQGKNLVGTFWQPSLVIIDTNALLTLTEDQFADGAAEVIKYGAIFNKDFFNGLENGIDIEKIDYVVEECVKMKRDIVHDDEFDRGNRQLLNFGHTIGHAIEMFSNFSISHGKAVAMGMALVSKSSWALGLSTENCYPIIEKTLLNNNLPVECPYSSEELMEAATRDKKISGSSITLVIPRKIGECYLHKIPLSTLFSFMEAARE